MRNKKVNPSKYYNIRKEKKEKTIIFIGNQLTKPKCILPKHIQGNSCFRFSQMLVWNFLLMTWQRHYKKL